MWSEPTPKRRWSRSQRFSLSPTGADAEADYRSTIVASRAQEGRASFEAARTLWAATLGLQPDDGAYLAELRKGPITLGDLVDALDTSGKTRQDAQSALGRLVDGGLVSASVQPSP
jgi:hypothetical protein